MIRIWDSSSSNVARSSVSLPSQGQYVTDLAIDPEGNWLAVGSRDARIQLWNLDTIETNQQPRLISTPNVDSLTFSPDGRF